MSAHSQFCVCDKCSSRIAMAHADGDARFGRDWRKGDGCGCAACNLTRKNLDDIDAGFERVAATEKRLATLRAVMSPDLDVLATPQKSGKR